MTERRTCISALVLVGYCLLQVCVAGRVTCNVTQGANQTTYSVPDEGGSGCSYSWANGSHPGHPVLANQDEWGKNVRSANVSIFITTACFPWVIYTRACRSEIEEHTSNCTIVCRENVVAPEDYFAEIEKTTSLSWIIPVIIISLAIVLVGLIYYKRRRTCFYSPVHTNGVEAQAPVEQ